MKFVYDDGGREKEGYKGRVSDCACRAITIATGRPYRDTYNEINFLANKERITKLKKKKSHARLGVQTSLIHKYMKSIGWVWKPTMLFGQGCKVHLRESELPTGRLVVYVSKHLVAVINGEIHDLSDCSRNGNRCVYGYYEQTGQETRKLSLIPANTNLKKKKPKYPNSRNTLMYDQPVASKAKVMAIAKKYNIDIDDDGYQLWADAPKGYHFTGLDLHGVTASYDGERCTKGQAWHMILTDIKDGVEKCDCEDCQEMENNL
jgi:hypothetical protein